MTLSSSQQFGLGFLSLPISLIVVSVITFVPTYYALDLGVGLAVTGFIFALGRMLDVVTDPLIGHLSDATRSPLGRRVPWMIAGGIVLCPAIYGFMVPSGEPTVFFLAISVGFFFLAVTLLDLPFSAVGLEISPHVHERTIIAAVKAIFQILGALVAPIIILIFAEDMSQALQKTALITIALILVGLVGFILLTPYKNQQANSFTKQTALRLSPAKALRAIIGMKDYRRLLVAFGLAQAGSAMTVGLTALLMAKHFQAPELTGAFIAILLLASAAGLPLWSYAAKRFGKSRSWNMGLMMGVVLMVCAFAFLTGPLWVFGVFCALFGLIIASDVILPTTILADIVSDNDPNENEMNSAGMMLGFKNAVSKLGFVGPMMIAFPVLGLLSVDTAESLDRTQYLVLLGFFAFLPACFRLLAMWVFPGSQDRLSDAGLVE